MRLRNFTAPSMQEAMARVRQELGGDAIIVSTDDTSPGEVRVTAAVEEAEPSAAQASAAADVTDRLSEALSANGVPTTLAEKILMASLALDTGDELESLSGAIAAVFSFAPIPERGRARPIMFVGAPGAGKTMTIAKLAARAVMAKRPIRLISADTIRAGAIEQLAAVARILGVRLHAVENVRRLAELAADSTEELTLIDSPGINPYNAVDRRDLATLVAAAGAEPMLVTAAGGDAVDCVEIARIFRDLGCSRMAVTRLDLTHRLGSVLAAAAGAKLAFSEAGVAPEIADGLSPFTPLVLARRLLAQSELADHPPLKKRGAS